MSSKKTLSKGVSEAQYAAFEEACRKAGLDLNDGKEVAFRRFCEAVGVEWPASFTHGGDRKSMKTYTINLNQVSWYHDNVEPPGNGRITMAKYARGEYQLELDEGHKLSVSLIEQEGSNATVEEALIVTSNNEIVRYLKPEQIVIK